MITYKSLLPEITLKYKKGDYKKVKIVSSLNLFELFNELYDMDTFEISESVIIIYLNQANNTLGWQKHSNGGSCQALIDIRLIMVTALQVGARSIVLSHNHPSGQMKPSEEDKSITRKVKEAADTLQLTLLDHIIMTENGYYSFSDEGLL